MRKYKYNKKAGALQEALYDKEDPFQNVASNAPSSSVSPPMRTTASLTRMPPNLAQQSIAGEHEVAIPQMLMRARSPNPVSSDSVDRTPHLGGASMFFYTVEEGQRVLMRSKDGAMKILVGPIRVWRRGRKFTRMVHHVAHPGDFLIVRYRDGRQEHLPGPSDVWLDVRTHSEITKEEALQIAAKEAVVVYSESAFDKKVARRIEHGPTVFIPEPGEWLHSFSWHGSAQVGEQMVKVPGGLVFEKLWLMPDQMYHNVPDVRTSDDAVLTVRLMMFFELVDIEKMLATTHDPIGDFVNAATSDVVDFVGRQDFKGFKQNTDKLNKLSAYPQLVTRAEQCGYRINKVVYRGYGAPKSLQQMHDQAIESRTRLQLEKETQRQAQELEDFKLERRLARESKERVEVAKSLEHELDVQRRRDAAVREAQAADEERQRAHFEALHAMGVDLTKLLTAGRADKIIELRGGGHTPHIHLQNEDG